jgi:hypothetical protein
MFDAARHTGLTARDWRPDAARRAILHECLVGSARFPTVDVF